MASAMRKVAVYLGLAEDREYDGYDDRYDYPAEEAYEDGDGVVSEDVDYDGSDRVLDSPDPDHKATVASLADRRSVSPTAARRAAPPREARITTLHPRSYNDARTLGEHFRDGVPVIMNLTDMDDIDAKRLVDFAAGLIFGLRGTIDRVTAKVFLLTPADVRVTAEDRARMAGGGFYNQS
jgi:cell division inhibitor SepF